MSIENMVQTIKQIHKEDIKQKIEEILYEAG